MHCEMGLGSSLHSKRAEVRSASRSKTREFEAARPIRTRRRAHDGWAGLPGESWWLSGLRVSPSIQSISWAWRAICKKKGAGRRMCHVPPSGVSRVEGKLARGCCDAQSKGSAHPLLSTAEMAETRVRAPGVVNDRSEMVISESGHIYLSCCTTGAAVVVPVTL